MDGQTEKAEREKKERGGSNREKNGQTEKTHTERESYSSYQTDQ